MMECLYAPRRSVPPAGSARYRARYRLRGIALHVDKEWPAGATANPLAYPIIKTPLSPRYARTRSVAGYETGAPMSPAGRPIRFRDE